MAQSASNEPSKGKVNRRGFLKKSAIIAGGAAALGAGGYFIGSRFRQPRSTGKKVIVVGIDGMDPRLTQVMMAQGELPNLTRLRANGGFSKLGTSIPPQSPVAWANFINGAGPGSHGIFDFLHRHPHEPWAPFYGGAETIPGQGTVLKRQGVPFWEYLDEKGIPSTFYDLPSNYPPSPSNHGHHRCISGMGTPDLMRSYGTYQHFATNNEVDENHPNQPVDEPSGKRFKLTFENDTARTFLFGPMNTLVSTPEPVNVDFLIHRDRQANAALIEIQDSSFLLQPGQWSPWIKVNFVLDRFLGFPHTSISGIVRFYLQEVHPNFKLYVSPINIDPSNPATRISEPASFVSEVSKDIGLFATTGFQEAYEARKEGVFLDDAYLRQANTVLEERLRQFEYAIDNYEDGMFFFYFSSCDLQSHIFWWDSDAPHPIRPDPADAKRRFGHVRQLYQDLDRVVGELYHRYGGNATIIVMSDHGFANFGRQFALNTWLRKEGYLKPDNCTTLMPSRDPMAVSIDWSQTVAYGMGINGLYLNLRGREPHGTVEPSAKEEVLRRLVRELEAFTETEEGFEGHKPIRNVYRADQVYVGNATALAPDLIVGYRRGYRASWDTCMGGFDEEVVSPNVNAWSADHCADALEVPGVLFCNKDIRAVNPALVDIAPSILQEFGLDTPRSMGGRSVF